MAELEESSSSKDLSSRGPPVPSSQETPSVYIAPDNETSVMAKHYVSNILGDIRAMVDAGVDVSNLAVARDPNPEATFISNSAKLELGKEAIKAREEEKEKRLASVLKYTQRTTRKLLAKKASNSIQGLKKELDMVSADVVAGLKKAHKAKVISYLNYVAIRKLCLKDRWTMKRRAKTTMSKDMRDQLIAANILKMED